MNFKKLSIFTITFCLIASGGFAQNSFSSGKKAKSKVLSGEIRDFATPRTHYWTSGFDGNIFQTSIFSKPGQNDKLSTLRFTSVFNIGFNYHNDFNKKMGFFTGIGIKNIGFIEKFSSPDSTVKRRIYALSVPLALKFGKKVMNKYGFIGASANLALNYKEKGYVKRSDKTKFNEWFSDRTPIIIPSVFVGYRTRIGFYVKLDYYPTNFLNADFKDDNSIQPYAGYNANLITLSAGFNTRMRPKYKSRAKTIEVVEEATEYDAPPPPPPVPAPRQ